MRPTFEQTVAILVKAYLNNQLEHRICTACAVGNLVAHALGTEPGISPTGDRSVHHNYVFKDGTPMLWWNYGIGQNQISEQSRLTGYAILELNAIELAFETAEGRPNGIPYIEMINNDEWIFNGLMAVVDVLAIIHGVDLTVKEDAKKLFVKA